MHQVQTELLYPVLYVEKVKIFKFPQPMWCLGPTPRINLAIVF